MKSTKSNSPKAKTLISWPFFVIVLVICGLFTVALIIILNYQVSLNHNTNQSIVTTSLPKFASCNALYNKLKEVEQTNYRTSDVLKATGSAEQAAEGGGGAEYSETNIQVEGVDEADTVKTDVKYVYTISGKIITISQAYPPDQAELLSKITYDDNRTPSDLFIDENNLLVFGYSYPYQVTTGVSEVLPSYSSFTFIEIYNLKDRKNPELKRKIELEGNYYSSRKIDNYVYFVLNSYPDYRLFENKPEDLTDSTIVPIFRDYKTTEITGAEKEFDSMVKCSAVSYIEPIVTDQYLTVVGMPIDDYDKEISKEVILGGSGNIYASLHNLYVANTNYSYSGGILNEIIPSSKEETVIYKFSLDQGAVKYQKKATVPGTVLNQFSMDEHKDYFRIAATIGHVSRSGGGTTNNVYVLDEGLKQVGSVEDIAPGEKIYSARFMGDKAYLVTFKKVDPFFTLDMSDPKNPKIVGKLKIPGYSDYLHPYDENHIIGIGKEAVDAEDPSTPLGADFAWYQGLKMAIFDVTDFANPKEMYKVVIGDRGTDSPVLNDHKAFLFSKDKNLLAIPVLLAEIDQSLKDNPDTSSNTYGDYVYQGTYVYKISLDKGFELQGRITHYEDDNAFQKSGYYFDKGNNSISRNLYIDNSLYSISNGKIKINSLTALADQGEIVLQ